MRDYDEARDYYVNTLGFELVDDTPQGEGKRWLLVAPPGAKETRLLLAKAVGDAQFAQIGNQSGGRVFHSQTDNFERDYREFVARGVRFCETPRHEPYGRWRCSKISTAETVGLIQLNVAEKLPLVWLRRAAWQQLLNSLDDLLRPFLTYQCTTALVAAFPGVLSRLPLIRSGTAKIDGLIQPGSAHGAQQGSARPLVLPFLPRFA